MIQHTERIKIKKSTKKIQILPKQYVFKDTDLIWDDIVIPQEFKENIQRSLILPVNEQHEFPRDFSYILFGPPGTGKTTIIKSIAKQLDWDFYNIGPQHFIKTGITIEEAVKICIENIKEIIEKGKEGSLSKKIFLFDEIDELLVSREGDADRETRLATTMMLPLIQDLRDLAKIYGFVFFVATNHIERFDSAITRLGRFDLILPLGPPDRVSRFLLFHEFIDRIRDEYLEKYNLEIKTEFDLVIGEEKKKEVTADLDVISRTSSRLTLEDIKSICKNVVEHQIARFPSLKNTKTKTELYLETNYFIDWIYKLRNLGSKYDIEKFYKDREKYYRGSTLYTKANTLQEKAQHEFGSLYVKHNLSKISKKWQHGKSKKIEFLLWNLSGLSPFEGQISAHVVLNNKEIKSEEGRKNESIQPGRASHQYNFQIKPNAKGKLKIFFIIEGSFDLLGIEGLLYQNKAELKGVTIQSREFKIL